MLYEVWGPGPKSQTGAPLKPKIIAPGGSNVGLFGFVFFSGYRDSNRNPQKGTTWDTAGICSVAYLFTAFQLALQIQAAGYSATAHSQRAQGDGLERTQPKGTSATIVRICRLQKENRHSFGAQLFTRQLPGPFDRSLVSHSSRQSLATWLPGYMV